MTTRADERAQERKIESALSELLERSGVRPFEWEGERFVTISEARLKPSSAGGGVGPIGGGSLFRLSEIAARLRESLE
jgi:hypothetical protein